MSEVQHDEDQINSSNGAANAAQATTHEVQVSVRLRAIDHSDRAIVANVSTVQPGSGMVFIDFGFIEQHAIAALGKHALDGDKTPEILDARLECRIAMSVESLAQLAQQLNQTLAGLRSNRVKRAPADTQLQ